MSVAPLASVRTTGLLPVDAYAVGYQDAMTDFERDEEARRLERAWAFERKLGDVLDRIDAVEPLPHLPEEAWEFDFAGDV